MFGHESFVMVNCLNIGGNEHNEHLLMSLKYKLKRNKNWPVPFSELFEYRSEKNDFQTDCETTVHLEPRKRPDKHDKDAIIPCRQTLIICGQRSPQWEILSSPWWLLSFGLKGCVNKLSSGWETGQNGTEIDIRKDIKPQALFYGLYYNRLCTARLYCSKTT